MTFEEYVELCSKNKKENKEENKEEKPTTTFQETYKNYDSVYTMDNSTAIILYIIVMVVGTIFNDRWLIYIAATLILIKHLTRHKK